MRYIVLKDFWLKDVCLRKGQIVTDPVSPRWLSLRLIGFYRDEVTDLNDAGITTEQINSANEMGSDDTQNPEIVAVVDEEPVKKKKKSYYKRKGVNYVKPELSEVIVDKIN